MTGMGDKTVKSS